MMNGKSNFFASFSQPDQRSLRRLMESLGVILKGSASAGAKSLIETLCASLRLRQEYKWK